MRLKLIGILIFILLLQSKLLVGLANPSLQEYEFPARVSWSPDGQWLAVGYWNVLYLYDKSFKLISQSTLPTTNKNKEWVFSLAWKADSQTLAISTVEKLLIWNAKTSTIVYQWADPDQFGLGGIMSLAWKPNTDIIAAGGTFEYAVLLDYKTNEITPIEAFFEQSRSPDIQRLEWSQDGKFLLVPRGYDGARLFDMVNLQVVLEFPTQPQEYDSSWSPNRKNVAQINNVSNDNENVIVVYTMTGQEVRRILLRDVNGGYGLSNGVPMGDS